jgi:hypothetical protein
MNLNASGFVGIVTYKLLLWSPARTKRRMDLRRMDLREWTSPNTFRFTPLRAVGLCGLLSVVSEPRIGSETRVSHRLAGAWGSLLVPRGAYWCLGKSREAWKEPTVAYLGNVYLVTHLSVDNLNKQCFHNTTYTYIYVLRTTLSTIRS